MDAVSVSAAKDLIRISAPSDSVLLIHEVSVQQDSSETSEQAAVQLQRSSTDGTGSSYTAVPHDLSDAAFGGTAVTNLTVDSTLSALLRRESFNWLNGYEYLPTPEMRIVVPPSGRFVVRLEYAPSAALTITVNVTFEEIG
jgi:hypothetical protein